MSDDELHDYKSHPEAFFGRIQSPGEKIEEPYELFEFFMDGYRNTPKNRLLDFMKDAPDYSELEKLDQADLAIEYAERSCASIDMGAPEN